MKEIQSTLLKHHDLYGVFGFGSFFRSDKYNDIDLLLVSIPDAKAPLSTYLKAKKDLDRLSNRIEIQIDITFLTYSEFLSKPLLEHDNLIEVLYKKT